MSKIKFIPLRLIENAFDVRLALDEDRVVQFAGMYEAGNVKLPPVKITPLPPDEDEEQRYAYIDGRHRGAARAYLKLEEVPAIIVEGSTPEELFAQAMEANWGGAKTMTREDIVHTIVRMFEAGASIKFLRERLTFLPRGSHKAYVEDARSILSKRRLNKARLAVAEGVKPETAAEQFKVNLTTLKNQLAGKKTAWGDTTPDQAESQRIQQYISTTLHASNVGIAMKLGHLLKQVEAGDVDQFVAEKALKAWSDRIRKTAIHIKDWEDRLTAITKEFTTTAKKKVAAA